jgi:hypothetical protein
MDKHSKLIRPAREILLPLLILAAFVSLARLVPLYSTPAKYNGVVVQRVSRPASWQGAAPADASKDPHYRLLLENSQVRVFALTLPPGSQSFVRHEHNYLTVTLEENEVIMWKDEESPIQHFRVPTGEVHFFFGGSAHGIRNESKTEYRNVTVEFLEPQVTTYGYRYESGKYDYGAVTLNPPVDPEGHFVNSLDLEKAEARDVQLLPKETLSPGKHPALAIAVTPVSVVDGPDRQISLKPGEVDWLERANAVLVNNAPGPARFTLVVFKPTGGKY